MGILWLATEAKLSRNTTVHKQVLGERHKATFVSTYPSVCSESSKVLRGSLECDNTREDVLVTVTDSVSVMGATMM